MDAIHIIIIDITAMISALGYLVAKLGPTAKSFNKFLADQHIRTKEFRTDTANQTQPSNANNSMDRNRRTARAVSGFVMSLGMVSLLSSAFIPGPVSSPLIVLCSLSVISVVIGMLILITDFLLHSMGTMTDGIQQSICTIHSSILDSNLTIAQMLVGQVTPQKDQDREEERPTSCSSGPDQAGGLPVS